MNTVIFSTTVLLSVLALPASALECANSGTATSSPPNDTGDGTATACGDGAVAGGLRGTALGVGASSGGTNSTAVGDSASSAGFRSTALGFQSSSAGDFGTALGRSASVAGNESVALGYVASASGNFSTALGRGASTVGDYSVAVGFQANVSSDGDSGIALGRNAFAGKRNSIALGRDAVADDWESIALGYGAFAFGIESIAVGRDATVLSSEGIAMGLQASSGDRSVALGSRASSGFEGVALGNSSSSGFLGVALGSDSSAVGDRSTALGYRASAPNPDTIVLGQVPGVGFGNTYVAVANGTTDPLAPLHIFRDDATRELLFLESDEAGGPQDRAMMFLANNGGIRFEFANNALATSWRFQAATGNQDRFEVTKVGTGQIEFWIDDLGNGFIAGDLDVGGDLLTNVLLPSDRNLKTRVEAIDPATVLDKVARLPLATWEYTDRPGDRHIGPMAQDFHQAFGLGRGDTSISVVDASGVALASIQALNEKLDAQRASLASVRALNDKLDAQLVALASRNRALEAKNAALEERLGLIEAMMTQSAPRTARN